MKGETDPNITNKVILELKLLDCLRRSDFIQLKTLISTDLRSDTADQHIDDIKKLLLNYAVQVSSLDMIKEIVSEFGSAHEGENKSSLPISLDINAQDEDGNTPLHSAAAQGRSDIIEYLLDQPNINDCITNTANLQPVELCKDLNVAQMMQLRRSKYVQKVSTFLKDAVAMNDFNKVDNVFKNPRNVELLDINGIDMETGENVLHQQIKSANVNACKWLLEKGADPFAKNAKGQIAFDILKTLKPNDKIKTETIVILNNLFEKKAKEKNVLDMTNSLQEAPTYKGYLKKFTNFAQGFKVRWFVLSDDGKLSYYKDQSDTKNHCRGSLNLANCYLHVNSSEKLGFEIIGGDSGTIKWNLKGSHPVETNKWIWAIQGAIRQARDKKNGVFTTPTIAKRTSSIPPIMAKEVKSNSCDRKATRTSSESSNDIELNDNLTASGKLFVNKVIETRLEPPVDGNGSRESVATSSFSKQIDASQNQYSSSLTVGTEQSNIVIQNINSDNYADGEAISDEDEDAIGTKAEMNEEDIEIEYGPFSQDITTLQQTISLELKLVTKLLDENEPNLDSWNIIHKSMVSAIESFDKLNNLTTERDLKLISMIDKQQNVNNIWIQSVRDLENELGEKEMRLESLQIERKNLKRIMQKKLNEVSEMSNESDSNFSRDNISVDGNTSTLEHIIKYMTATKEENEDSDADEFFDAEESHDEDEYASIFVRGNTSNTSNGKENVPFFSNVDNIATDTNINNIIKPKEVVSKVAALIDSEIFDQKVLTTKANAADIAVPKVVSKVAVAKATPKVATPEVIKKTLSITSKTSTIKSSPKFISSNVFQEKKEAILNNEGTYLGYEDGTRKRLKLDEDDRPKIGLWSVLKSMVGKDMTRMTLPVSFNEPSSLLQRVAEDLEYSDMVNHAAQIDDSTLRMLYVAGFASSSYASTTLRVAKPFNPLLGETYEYARPDKVYRFFTEQVSHHPPISATWTETPKWDFWGESYVDTKFTGRTFNVKHLGLWYLNLRPDQKEGEELYTWMKPNNTVIGILVGNPQVDINGDIEVKNHMTGDRCLLHFKARGWRASSAFEVRGEVYDKKGKKTWVLGGHWNDSIYAKKVTNDNTEISLDRTKTNPSLSFDEPKHDGSTFLLWKVNKRPVAPFHLTPFAITLNAPQPSLIPWLAPTDTRLRPDQRAMEDGKYDIAASEKNRLEVKQRAIRREREKNNTEYHPQWFSKEIHPITKKPYWNYNGEYWKLRKEHKLKDCGDIF